MKPSPELVAAAREAFYNNQGRASDDPFELALATLEERGLIRFHDRVNVERCLVWHAGALNFTFSGPIETLSWEAKTESGRFEIWINSPDRFELVYRPHASNLGVFSKLTSAARAAQEYMNAVVGKDA